MTRPYAQHAQARPVRLDPMAYVVIVAIVLLVVVAAVILLIGLSS